ncbi:MAG TPA: hypothetical protein VFT72_17100 [Opitutaceae bacterium]|nr:hypothetical protein [Opitutaceae bacterium]
MLYLLPFAAMNFGKILELNSTHGRKSGSGRGQVMDDDCVKHYFRCGFVVEWRTALASGIPLK